MLLHMKADTRNSKLSHASLLWSGMDPNKSALERAFELARTGRYPTVELIRRAISAEGYFQSQIEGRELTRQLKALITASANAPVDDT
ncbi:MAG: hypothetical protein EON57_00925 [Alphaproteobacteria bacterium]|nr:MAG: hypothetical protein EON57_00925 [Alphaproteobacteria bacterium]